MQTFDAIVIGAGSGGLTAAAGLRAIGKSVLLVERDHMGGECTNTGCIPSKALLHHAKCYAAAVAISGKNGNTENYRREAFEYVREVRSDILREETPEHFAKRGITVVAGEAVFTGRRTIEVAGTVYRFTTAIIATGSSPRLVSVPGLDMAQVLTNQNLFELDDTPKRTLIIGAGPIGLEMGQALNLLGSHVTIVDPGTALGKLEDPAVGAILQQKFMDLGITFIPEAHLESVTEKVAHIALGETGETTDVPFDKILIAIGRVPNLPNGLESADIASETTGITVNRNYQTSNRRVYALGDCADRLKFTHQADAVARQVVTRIATRGLTSVTPKTVPKVTYTEPELAQVGMHEHEAVTAFGANSIHRIQVPFSNNDRARTDDTTEGVLVVIVRRLTGKILGAHIAGPAAGELITLFTLAIDNNLSLWKLRRTIFAYPTYSLVTKKAGDQFFSAQITSLKSDLSQVAKRILPKVLLLVAWVGLLWWLSQYKTVHHLSVRDIALQLFDIISHTAWGPILYILAYTIRPITFLPGTILTILSGVFFGLWGGIIYTIIGANLSATFAYIIGRYFGTSKASSPTSLLGRFAAACRTKPFATILTVRLLYLPFDAVNYGAGFLRIPFLPYLIATFLGTILGIATFVAIGAAVSIEEFKMRGITANAIDANFLILSALIFGASLGIAKVLQRKK